MKSRRRGQSMRGESLEKTLPPLGRSEGISEGALGECQPVLGLVAHFGFSAQLGEGQRGRLPFLLSVPAPSLAHPGLRPPMRLGRAANQSREEGFRRGKVLILEGEDGPAKQGEVRSGEGQVLGQLAKTRSRGG